MGNSGGVHAHQRGFAAAAGGDAMRASSPLAQLVALLAAQLGATAQARTWVVDAANPRATDKGPATATAPLKTISAAAASAERGDTVLVHGGAVYRERVAPASGNVAYIAAPGASPPIIRGSEPLPAAVWTAHGGPSGQPGVWVTPVHGLPFETIAGAIFNPYAIRLAFPGNESVSGSDGSSCDGGHTLGQLFQAGHLLTELSGARKDFHCNCTGKSDCTGGGHGCPGTYRYSCGTACHQACGSPCGLDVRCLKAVCDDDTCGCSHAGQLASCCNFTGTNAYSVLPSMSWMAVKNGTEIWARFGDDSTQPAEVEATVRKTVFAPHTRGLGNITVRGFVLEHAANQWDDFFWLPRRQANNPSPAAFAQGGLLSTRSGHNWLVEHNVRPTIAQFDLCPLRVALKPERWPQVLRQAKTIGIDIGDEGGADSEGTQQMPWVIGNHTVRWNRIVDNGGKGITGEFGTVGPQPYRNVLTGELQSQPCPGCEVHRNRGGVIAHNIIAGNNFLGCGAAENAALKVHGFSGDVVGNLLVNNFDSAGM